MATPATRQREEEHLVGMLRSEIEAINERRRALGRDELPVRAGCEPPAQVIEAVGLALSGGGIRSAAVSLGALQALNHHGVLRNIDYLSTVSGGGFIGTSLTVTMTKDDGRFVFGPSPNAGTDAPLAAEISDTDEVGHIRNYSNYLIPAGARDVVTAIAVIVRGLVANLGLVLPVLLLLAALTIWSNPNRSSLERTDFLGFSPDPAVSLKAFGLTLIAALVGLALFFAWAVARSFLAPRHLSEFRGTLPFLASLYLVALAGVFFVEGQAFVINGMFEIADAQAAGQRVFLGMLTSWVKTAATVTAPVAAVVMLFRNQFGEILKVVSANSRWWAQLVAVLIKGAMWLAALAVPLLVWVAYLYLSYWGIINDRPNAVESAACPRGTISATVRIDGQQFDYRGDVGRERPAGGPGWCAPLASDQKQETIGPGTHTPTWLLQIAGRFGAGISHLVDKLPGLSQERAEYIKGRLADRPMISLYVGLGLLLAALSCLLAPNANSLARLYRDRLSKAFLFNPKKAASARRIRRDEASLDQGRDFEPVDDMRVSELSTRHAPYHLINAALNIQGSDYANRRGRNADFFLFSPRYIGSCATGYASMATFEDAAPDLDLATAMAISGAAASSNMGASSVRSLTPTLALLNVRLGYWLKNPRFCSPSATLNARGSGLRDWMPKFYLWSEITGRLYENSTEVYLTDGGHIENLGIYELLRRRCKVIVVVDADADFPMLFPPFVTLQRYARIDLGIRIYLPWLPIQTTTLALREWEPGMPPPEPLPGPHVAIGTIDYGGGQTGYLVYIKSSLTGDENDYVRDYARRHDKFPHEISLDQLFSEEQFEVYRALGFHMTHGFLDGGDRVCVAVQKEDGEHDVQTLHFADDSIPAFKEVRAALIG
jgi:Patatin-like phospholipase